MKQNEVVLVTKKEGEWWTGTIGDRSGMFPSNYVEYCDPQVNIYRTALKLSFKLIKL